MAPMSTETVDHLARAAGLVLSAAELERLTPMVVRLLETLESLESLPLAGAEPAIQYRIL